MSSLMALGTSPGLQLLSDLLGALGAIISVIIEPFQPFIDLLNIFAMALSAALLPLTAEVYEALIPAFGEIIEQVPLMTAAIVDFITENPTIFTDLTRLMMLAIADLIPKIVELLPDIAELTLNFLKLAPSILGIIPALLKLSVMFIDIIAVMIEQGLLTSLVKLGETFMKLATVILPIITFIVNVLAQIPPWLMGLILGGIAGFMVGGLPGAIIGAIAGMGMGIAAEFASISSPDTSARPVGSTRQYGGMIPTTDWYYLHAGEEVKTAEGGAGMGAVEIHIHGNVYGIDNLKDEIFDEYEKRKRLGLI